MIPPLSRQKKSKTPCADVVAQQGEIEDEGGGEGGGKTRTDGSVKSHRSSGKPNVCGQIVVVFNGGKNQQTFLAWP